jgi:hypothetical protein
MTMPLVSVSISYGSQILRPFAIVMAEDIALLELHRVVCAGDVGDGPPVEIPGGSARPVKTMVKC